MSKISLEDLENMSQSKLICELDADIIEQNLFGSKKKQRMHFYIYDGLAYSNYKDKEYLAEFPKVSFVKTDCKEMAESVMDFCGIEEKSEISAVDIFNTYGIIAEV